MRKRRHGEKLNESIISREKLKTDDKKDVYLKGAE